MMMLLQCPCSISPSRNQTPGAMIRTVSGVASERATKSATNPSVVNNSSSSERRCFIDPLADYSTPVFVTNAGENAAEQCKAPYVDGSRHRKCSDTIG